MPGYVIHIAIAKEYFKKHENEKLDEFIDGTIFPDSIVNKSLTHYGKSPAYTNLFNFLKNNKLNTAFNRGHFLHLVTDYLFYNHYLNRFSKPQIYDDYDFLNEKLMKKYEITLPEKIRDKVFFKEGIPQILNIELVEKMVEEISNLDLKEVALEVEMNLKKWNTYKNIV